MKNEAHTMGKNPLNQHNEWTSKLSSEKKKLFENKNENEIEWHISKSRMCACLSVKRW